MQIENELLFIDTETGGLDPVKHSLLSVGLVQWKNGAIFNSKEIFINDGHLVATKRALEINQIDLEKHKESAISPSDAIVEIIHFIESIPTRTEKIFLAGHNINFDVNFLKTLFASQNVDFGHYFSHRIVDTSSILHFLYFSRRLNQRIISSSEAFEYFGIKVKGRHTALGDAIATAELFSELVKLNHKG